MPTWTRRQLLSATAAAGLSVLVSGCGSVSGHKKLNSGLTRSSSFAISVDDDVTETRARLTAHLINRGYNVIASLPTSYDGDSDEQSDLPGRLRRVSNAIPEDAPEDTGFASRYVLEVNHRFKQSRRFGIKRTEYTRFTARMVDRATGQILLSAYTDGGKIDDTLEEVVDVLDRQLSD